MSHHPEASEIRALFENSHPDQVWSKAMEIIQRIHPDYDFIPLSAAFRDVVGLFYGEYPGYHRISTLYHDLRHTLDIFLCTLRLLHSIHLSGDRLSAREVTIGAVAALLHDVGYAQQVGDETGTGAKYTRIHVDRSIAFMQRYLVDRNWPSDWSEWLACAIRCTDPAVTLQQIAFPDERARLIGRVVGTADLVGQMADRSYLEKLLFLYFEFREAHLGDYQSAQDLLRRTQAFYALTGKRLETEFGNIHETLSWHFKDCFGVECNYYVDSIDKNIAYLAQVIQHDEGEYFQMLKRGGIVDRVKTLDVPE